MSLRPLLLMLWLTTSPLWAGERVEAQALMECARAALLQRAPDVASELELTAAPLEPSRLDDGEPVRLQAGSIDGSWPRRRVGVPVTIWRGDKQVQSRMVWFDVRQWREVQVYARDARTGETGDEVPLQVERTDLLAAALPATGLLSNAPAQARLRRAVRRGQLALAADFETLPAVTRADEVRLRLRGDGLQLTTVATAQRDGQVGEWIEVIPRDGTPVRARVTARNEVTLEQ
jgi:flagella basal body P-ring formation protein FlgA